MAGPNLPPLLLPQSVAITFVVGLFYGFYLITVCYANRWLFFTDEGWRFRKQINWFTVAITNLISTLLLADVALSVRTPMSQTAFVEKGHRPDEFTYPPWEPIVEVSLFTSNYSRKSELTCDQCMLANAMALLADIVLVSLSIRVYPGNISLKVDTLDVSLVGRLWREPVDHGAPRFPLGWRDRLHSPASIPPGCAYS